MEVLLAGAGAFWLGVLTAISPCPLATNLAAVSILCNAATAPARAVASGLAYTVGRATAYTLLAAVLAASLLSSPVLSHLLQKYMNQVLGPLLVIVAMLLLELLSLPSFGFAGGSAWRERMIAWREIGAGALGFVFALSFCPVSAALYLGSLLPLTVERQSPLLLPALYGIGTALPVLVFALVLAAGARPIAPLFGGIKRFEWWARTATGIAVLVIGIYLTLRHVFGLPLPG